jgi:serine/threonine-protein kinase
LQPDAGEVHLNRGIVHYWGHRDYAPALAELELARRALPNSAEVWYFIGLIERRQAKWEESTRHLEQARAMDPRNEIILFDLARTNYFALKRYREAAETCDSVLAWKPEAFDFQLARAKVEVSSRADVRRWQEVVFGEPAKHADVDLLAFERLDLALAQRDYHAAEKALSEQSFPEFNWAGYVTPRAFYEGLIAQGLGDAEKAKARYTAARDQLAVTIAKRPDDAKAHIIFAQIEARLGHKEEAIAAAKRALELRPPEKDAVDGPNIMGLMAGIYAQLGETELALDLLESIATRPMVTNYGSLQLDDMWDSVRADPRFEKILATLRSKEASS